MKTKLKTVISNMKKEVKKNLNGYFTYRGYVDNTRPDIKFGHTKIEYVCQIPVIGLVFSCFVGVILNIIIILVVWYHVLKNYLKKRQQTKFNYWEK